MKFGFDWPSGFMFEIVDDDDGAWVYYKLTAQVSQKRRSIVGMRGLRNITEVLTNVLPELSTASIEFRTGKINAVKRDH